MAKRPGTIAATEHRIEGFAEDLGKMLGHARTKAQGWMDQRQAIVKNLTELRDEASRLLGQLGHDAAVAGRRGRRAMKSAVSAIRRGPGRPAGSKNAIIIVGGKKRRKMSAKARAAISVAQKARWAKQKAGVKK
jgi:prophage DNA circulation protein